jgi:putative effector of murein hydrolase
MERPICRTLIYLPATPLFGLTVTLVVYVLAQAVFTRLGQVPWADPVLWTVVFLALVRLATGVP